MIFTPTFVHLPQSIRDIQSPRSRAVISGFHFSEPDCEDDWAKVIFVHLLSQFSWHKATSRPTLVLSSNYRVVYSFNTWHTKYIKENCSNVTVQSDLFIIPQEVNIFLEKKDCPGSLVNHSVLQWNVTHFMSVRQSPVIASKQLKKRVGNYRQRMPQY